MDFMKFTLLNVKDGMGSRQTEEVEMLININHVVSIKPIRISLPDKLINGFWIRTTNGKKYKATIIPEVLLKSLGEEYSARVIVNYDAESDDQPFHQ